MLTIAYSGKSKPSALAIAAAANTDDYSESAMLYRSSSYPVLVNWGRNRADATLNPDISNVTNKKKMRQLFAENNVPMPKLYSAEEAAVLANDGVKLVGRPDKHSKKRGFWLIKSLWDFRHATIGTRTKKAATHFMEHVEHDREYRVHIFKGKSIRISRKEYENGNKYTTAKPGDIKLKTVREAAKLAVSAVGLDFGAVDILARGDNNEEVFVLEVNAAPGLGGSTPRLYADTFKKWAAEGDSD